MGITPMIKEGKRKIQIEFENKSYIKEIEIKKFHFKKTKISFNKEKAKLITQKKSTKQKEQALVLWNIIGNTGDTTIYHYDALVKPIKDQYIVTSLYGDLRLYMQGDKKFQIIQCTMELIMPHLKEKILRFLLLAKEKLCLHKIES